MTNLETATDTTIRIEEESTTKSAHVIDSLWRGLSQPWLPILCAILLLLTVLASFLLPQMSAELSEDPATAARWLSNTAAEYGLLGSAFSALGLFRAMNSLLWRFLTVLLGFLLLLHLLRLWLLDRQMSAAQQALKDTVDEAGTPILLSANPALQRTRVALEIAPDLLFTQLQDRMRLRFDSLQSWQQTGAGAETTGVEAKKGGDESTSDGDEPQEYRILGVRGRKELRLQMLLLAGGLLAISGLWWLNVAGWRVQTEPLTPFERFRDDWRNIAIDFRLQDDLPVIIAQQGESRIELAVPASQEPLSAGAVHAVAGAPALLVQSLSKDTDLRRPDGASAAGVGLLFPSPGSEETLILPQQETVLRIVRRTDAEPLTFTIEAIQALPENESSQTKPQQTNRFEIASDETRTITLGESEATLRFLPIYSRQVEVTSLPGLWLLWLALPFTLIGALLGLRKKPGFAFLQIAPWYGDRSVVVTQGSETIDV